ncbi:hypothetical protein SAMN05216341_10511 [Leuconostocaceae bacterium R-53105]|uniref:Uncharacterized protein n=1 Tax=Convivina intestini TaxID=1505726 RepID=A0A2U1D7P5_9LACO|nr:hypothetical protein C7384_10610 [Convivina intestini]CAH1855178.1 hypothetical protein R077811_01010 [Convivina intestini]SDB92184.1 hypothetical protein SAMN05216341_10511 [Leuconostocaceae bacterium R-53105]
MLLDEYADWEGAYLSSMLNKTYEWCVEIASNTDTVTSIGGFKTLVDRQFTNLINDMDFYEMGFYEFSAKYSNPYQ